MVGLVVFGGAKAFADKRQATAASTAIPKKLADGSRQVDIDAKWCWVDTTIKVKAGDVLTFSAAGEWGESEGVTRSADGGEAGILGTGYWASDALIDDAPWGALIGRIGSQKFLIGRQNTITATENGTLWLSINDDPDNFDDNHGTMVVTIKKHKS